MFILSIPAFDRYLNVCLYYFHIFRICKLKNVNKIHLCYSTIAYLQMSFPNYRHHFDVHSLVAIKFIKYVRVPLYSYTQNIYIERQ